MANVIILSHNREKFQFITKQNELQNEQLKKLEKELKTTKENLANDTKDLKELQHKTMKLSQTTGIMSDKNLSKDYEDRATEIKNLQD